MHTIFPLTLTVLIVAGVLGMGTTYLIAPQTVVGSFGLNLPASDPDTRAWLRLKGIRDVASGLVVLTLMLLAGKHFLGIALLVYAVIPFGDMVIVLASKGSTAKAFSIHGLTCAVMLAAGLLLTNAL